MANAQFLNDMILLLQTLTVALKQKYFEKIIERDDGFYCFYCKTKLELEKFVYEHLNDNRADNRLENIVFACYSCNNKKTSSESLKEIALAKLKDNEGNVLCVREFEESETASVEINLNRLGMKMTQEFLEEKFQHSDSIDKIDAKRCIALRMYNKIGSGSESTISKHLNAFCCSEGKYEQVGKKIVKRTSIESGQENIDNHNRNNTLDKTTKLRAIELNLTPEIEPKNRHKIEKLSKELHNEEKCKACETIKEHEKRTDILLAIYHKSSSKEKDNLLLDIHSKVDHCASFFCNRPVFDGRNWCGDCVNFWSKMMNFGGER
ncbi:hypothetical protein [Nitrosopumilus sp.]|uniref:hypothetical protein n=1 Tax=Nitrosopumilus sp. TaxID=2024843 RepID=UPI003D0B19A5